MAFAFLMLGLIVLQNRLYAAAVPFARRRWYIGEKSRCVNPISYQITHLIKNIALHRLHAYFNNLNSGNQVTIRFFLLGKQAQ